MESSGGIVKGSGTSQGAKTKNWKEIGIQAVLLLCFFLFSVCSALLLFSEVSFLCCCFLWGRQLTCAWVCQCSSIPSHTERPPLVRISPWQSCGWHTWALPCLLCTACLSSLLFSQSILFLSYEFQTFPVSLRILISCLYGVFIWFSISSCFPLIISFFQGELIVFHSVLSCFPAAHFILGSGWLCLSIIVERRVTWVFLGCQVGFLCWCVYLSVFLLFHKQNDRDICGYEQSPTMVRLPFRVSRGGVGKVGYQIWG